MFRSSLAAVLVVALVLTAATGITQAQDPTNGDDLIFRAIAGESFVIHRYTTVGSTTFTPPDGVDEVEYLIVGGGGGGGANPSYSTAPAGGGGRAV